MIRILTRFLKIPSQIHRANVQIEDLHENLRIIQQQIESLRIQQAELVIEGRSKSRDLQEMRVFSQWGEDGLIAGLLSQLPEVAQDFVEFGVQDYQEANTRFLLMSRGWRGLIMDDSEKNIQKIRNTPDFYWKYPLQARQAWITRENINEILTEEGFTGEIGLLSIDLDGNDYFVWEAVEVARPAITIIEYNSLFGADRAVTIPYQEDFDRAQAHHSHLFFGASLPALNDLAKKKGYRLVAGNQAGNNAFFLREDLLGSILEKRVEDVFKPCQFRESRDKDGRLNYLNFAEAQRVIAGLPVYDVRKQALVTF